MHAHAIQSIHTKLFCKALTAPCDLKVQINSSLVGFNFCRGRIKICTNINYRSVQLLKVNFYMMFATYSSFSTSICTILPRLTILLIFVLCKTKAVMKLPPNVSIPAVFVFGDSIMDTGNNNKMITPSQCNYPPYGKDFQGGISTGRFSNGKVPSDFIVEELGIKEYLPAYLDPNLQLNELPTGVNFASGGAGYDPLTSKLGVAISISGQLDLFKDYIVKLKGVVGEDRAKFIIGNSLFFVVLGSNDISNTYYLSRMRQVQYDFPTYSDLLVNSAYNFYQEMYELGARRIGVFNAPPMGCVPFQRTMAGGIERKCVQEYNDAVVFFNNKLSIGIDSFKQNFPSCKISYMDVYNPLLDIIVNNQKYGYKVGDRGCCGTGKIEVTYLCTHLQPICSNDLDYVFWDSFHPTESVYKKLVTPILHKYMDTFI